MLCISPLFASYGALNDIVLGISGLLLPLAACAHTLCVYPSPNRNPRMFLLAWQLVLIIWFERKPFSVYVDIAAPDNTSIPNIWQ